MLTLFSAASVNGQRATIGLLESGLPHRLVPVDLKRRPAALRRASRYGRVPTLLDSEAADGRPLVLDQSGAILLYLGEKCGHLVPTAPRARAECHRWLLLHANDLGPAFIASYTMTRLGQPQDLAAADCRARVLRFCGMLDERLAEARFLSGESFSIADCAAYPDVTWCFKDFPGVERLTHLRRWMEEVGGRPAVAQAMAWAQRPSGQ